MTEQSFDKSEVLVSGRYRLSRVLGEGSLAKVYQAEDIGFNPPRPVALKLFHPWVASMPETSQNLRHEAGLLARFNHPNILRLLDFAAQPGQAYLVTELAEGGSLRDKIRPEPLAPGRPLPLTEVASYLEQIAAGLDEAHSQEVIHRDLKPSNILLDQHNRPLLADFGLATIYEPEPDPERSVIPPNNGPFGTLLYMAPEQWEGNLFSKASDIYALGVIVYQLITGQTPFQGPVPALAIQVLKSPVPKLSEKLAGLVYPPALDEVLAAALAKNPAQRPTSALDFYYRFKAALETDSSHQSSLLPGVEDLTPIGGYEPKAPVDMGTYLRTYLAVDPRFNQEVNLQVLFLDELTLVGVIEETFRRGALIHSRLHHPNIPTLYSYGEDYTTGTGRFYLATEVTGPGLNQRLRGAAPLELALTAKILTQVGAALDYLHGQGWVHGNIKPSNIRLNEQGKIWLTNFQLARPMGQAIRDSENVLVGTPAYMSPEQVAGEALDGRSDQYSLATVLYEMLAGRPPFDSETAVKRARGLELPVSNLNQFSPELPITINEVLKKALSLKPEERYNTIGEFAAAFQQTNSSVSLVPASFTLTRLHTIGPAYAGTVEQVEWSPGGHELVTLSGGINLNLWREDGTWLTGLSGSSDFSWSPDKNRALLASTLKIAAQAVAVWGSEGMIGELYQQVAAQWTPDGQVLATLGQDGRIRFWNQGRELYYTFPKFESQLVSRIESFSFSSDGELFCYGMSDGKVACWRWRYPDGTLFTAQAQHSGPVTGLVWSPDSQLCASWASSGSLIGLWQPEKRVSALKLDGAVVGVEWSPDSQKLAVLTERREVELWQVDGYKLITLKLASGQGKGLVRWSPDGQYLATSGGAHLVHLGLNNGKLLTNLEIPDQRAPISDLAWSPDGAVLAVTSTQGEWVGLWSVYQQKVQSRSFFTIPGGRCMSWARDSHHLAIGNSHGEIEIWSIKSLTPPEQ